MRDYRQLQNRIDKVIGQIGLEQTMFLLEGFINNIPIKSESGKKVASHYIIDTCIETFFLNEKEFFKNGERDYRDARYCCFYLMHKYIGNTSVKTASFSNLTGRQVQYGCNVTKERLAFPKFHSEFIANYKDIESKIVAMLVKLTYRNDRRREQ
jgi:hypothetical protein